MSESPNKKNVIMDSQILSTIMSCPRLADFRFNHNFVGIYGKSKSLAMGSIVHTVLESYYKGVINKLKKSDAEQFALVAGLEYAQSDEAQNCPDEEKDWALQTAKDYFEHYRNDFWVPIEVETVKGDVLYEDDDIRILYKAKIDVLMDTNSGIFSVDHKTMSQRRDVISLNNQFTGQAILTGQRMIYVNKIGFQKTLKPAERFQRATVNFTADRLSEWRNIILPFYAKQLLAFDETGFWPPNFTHCENKYGFCQFRDVCEADRNMREEVIQQNFTVGDKWDVTNTD